MCIYYGYFFQVGAPPRNKLWFKQKQPTGKIVTSCVRRKVELNWNWNINCECDSNETASKEEKDRVIYDAQELSPSKVLNSLGPCRKGNVENSESEKAKHSMVNCSLLYKHPYTY